MNKPFYLKFFFIFIFNSSCVYLAQSQVFDKKLSINDSTQTHVILFKNGMKEIGYIKAINNDVISFYQKKENKDTTLSLSTIHQIRVKSLFNLDSKFSTPFDYVNYLFYINTAFGLKKGQHHYKTFLGASVLYDYGLGEGHSFGISYGFPFLIGVNLKFAGSIGRNSNLALKTNYLIRPTIWEDGEKFWIYENSLTYTHGTPDRFFNLSYSNYLIKFDNFFFFPFDYVPNIYNSISVGGGIRVAERWQLILENHVNFNSVFLDAKFLPSFGLSYSSGKFNIGFGFHAANQRGLNLLPITEFNDNEEFSFSKEFLGRLPFFTYAKIF